MLAAVVAVVTSARGWSRDAATDGYVVHDAHVHLTNYIQQGTDIRRYVEIMGDRIGRSTLFGIPLQQTWSYENSGEYAPTYYLQSDAPPCYYSFTDAFIANAYLKLEPEQRVRLDPMITGINPADMYAIDHIRRVLETCPGVLSGIGEFTIHKEFVSSKVAGEIASLQNPALDRILDFAGEVGLGGHPAQRHRHAVCQGGATERSPTYRDLVEALLSDPGLSRVYFDISWDEVAKYAVSSPEAIANVSAMLNKFPDRFLFGTDNVAPPDLATQLRVFNLWDPIWAQLTPEASLKVRRDDYERIFDAARTKVRAWEAANVT